MKATTRLPRYQRPIRIRVEVGTRPGAQVHLKTFGGAGPARYDGDCCGCGRNLFTDLTDPECLSLGVHETSGYDEFPEVRVCFECHSERALYDALCARKAAGLSLVP